VVGFFDLAIKDLNTQLFEFNRVAETGIVMTAAQEWVVLSDKAFKISQTYLTHNTKGDEPPITELPWTHFKKLYANDQTEGKPFVCASFNMDADQRLYLYYTPNASTVADYTLAVEYYRRIPLFSEIGLGHSLLIPQEVENALSYAAQKRLAIHVLGAGHPDVAVVAALETEALGRLKRSDRTKPAQQLRFSVGR
jgi:hypothetical protein